MINFLKNSATVIAVILLFLLTGLIPSERLHLPFTVEAGEEGACIDYDQTENTINVNCNASSALHCASALFVAVAVLKFRK